MTLVTLGFDTIPYSYDFLTVFINFLGPVSLRMASFLRPLYESLGTLVNMEAASNTRTYEYETISPDEIRIVTLHPGSGDICISIARQAIDQSSEHVYAAVSYVWGSPRLSRYIQCNGAPLKVTANVLELLQRLRHKDNPIRLWIDAICINQLDVPERNHQVSLMKSIYSNASQVLIWTGKQDSNTSSVFSWFESIVREEDAFFREPEKNSFRHIATFINRPWFHRAWTFQELCLAKDAQILCGTHQLPWGTIARAFKILESHGLSQSVFGDIADCMTASSRFYANAPEREHPYLSTVLPLTRKLEATDPRDKVFAMLGLVDVSRLRGIKPDYTLSVAEVYTSCTRAMIVQEQGLSVFSSVTGKAKGQDLPSWVPDWRAPRRTAYLYGYDWPATTNFYELNQHAPIRYQLEPGAGAYLPLDGAHICSITSIHSGTALLKAFSHGHNLSTDPVGAWNSFFPRFIELYRSLDLPGIYPQTGESSQMALLRVLPANHLPGPEMIQSFVTETIDRSRRRARGGMNERIKRYLDDPKFKELESKVKAGTNAADDIDSFLFLCQMALDVLDFKLPRPRGSFFGTSGQRIFGYSVGYDIVDYITSMVQTFLRNRVVFKTDNGLIGLGPDYMAVGDQVWDLLGGSVPFILRKPAANNPEKEFSLVGECYVHGIMNGEIWSSSMPNTSSTCNGRELKFEKIKLV